MKIAILGTRGIPNQYGGFEQLAEYLAVQLVQRGHDVSVYQSSLHPYKAGSFQGVKLIRCNDPEKMLGTAGQFLYDLGAILDSRNKSFDIILQLGYTSNSIWSFLLPSKAKIITNMDGLEWKRSKYNPLTRLFLRYAEKRAVNSSDLLIADSKGIGDHLLSTYNKQSIFIPYGAIPVKKPDQNLLLSYQVEPSNYFLVIARFEPENNQEMIIKGYLSSDSRFPLLLIGATDNKPGSLLKAKYESERIRFPGANFNLDQLNALRYYSRIYFHGHSVGGTNPSLLEAMASGAFICAHDNGFNRTILGGDACYFSSGEQVANCIHSGSLELQRKASIENNLEKIKKDYLWKDIIDAYEKLFYASLKHV